MKSKGCETVQSLQFLKLLQFFPMTESCHFPKDHFLVLPIHNLTSPKFNYFMLQERPSVFPWGVLYCHIDSIKAQKASSYFQK